MKLNAEYMKAAIQAIMDDEGMSPEEIANAAGLNRTAVYKILNGETAAVRRSTIRQIADGLDYSFIISDDKVTFIKNKKEKQITPPDFAELLSIYDRLSPDGKKQLLKIAGVLCGSGGVQTEAVSTN